MIKIRMRAVPADGGGGGGGGIKLSPGIYKYRKISNISRTK